ncbi:PilW family protein [Pseudoalteromonas sp. T1lg65]|uniref:PilW family protein n=1 Tax=Pseudoalteromonas sp. T1lg65 TaxID=2077101 RepID=UPI003F79ACDF
MTRSKKGFTLVELLVSVVILLTVITTVSMIYRGAFISSEKASTYIQFSSSMTGILDLVRYDIRNSPFERSALQGSGTNGKVSYSWSASQIKEKSYPAPVVPGEFGFAQGALNRYKLWLVTLNVEAQGITRQYQFREVNWRDR